MLDIDICLNYVVWSNDLQIALSSLGGKCVYFLFHAVCFESLLDTSSAMIVQFLKAFAELDKHSLQLFVNPLKTKCICFI
jgi:hypothetical protein